VVKSDPGAQTDLLAARQEIEILDVPGIDQSRR